MTENILSQYPNTKHVFDRIHELFETNGHDIRIAGGAVRDMLMGIEPSDLDFCTTATPDQMMQFKDVACSKAEQGKWYLKPTGLPHGTVTLITRMIVPTGNGLRWCKYQQVELEVTTLRRDVECDGRHAEVEFTDNWCEDATRRDFTINAMTLDIEGNIYDYYNGLGDIKQGLIRFVCDPDDRIKEDALRMIRALRFIARHDGNKINADDLRAITNNAELIKNITVERIWNEYKKMVAKSTIDGMKVYDELLTYTGLDCELDFPVQLIPNSFSLDYRRKYPAMYLATHIKDLDKAIEFYKKYKMSRIERKQVEFMVKYGTSLKTIDLTFQLIDDLLEQEYDRDWICAVCNYHNATYHEDYARKKQRPVFDVKAQDLLDADPDLKEGRQVGIWLNKVKQSWVESRYAKEKEELIYEFQQQRN